MTPERIEELEKHLERGTFTMVQAKECLEEIGRLQREMFIKEDMMDFAEHISGKQVVNSELDAWVKRQKVK